MNEEEREQQEPIDTEALEDEYEEEPNTYTPEDAFGGEGSGEESSEESEPEPAPEEEEETPQGFTPPQISAQANPDREARLREALGPELYADLMAQAREEAQALVGASAYANTAMLQAAQQMPQLFKVLGPKIAALQHHVPQNLKTSKPIAAAMSLLILEETQSDSDLPATLARLSKLAGSAPAPKAKTPQRATLGPAQRTPSAGASVAGGKGQGSAFERDVKVMMDKYGLTRAEAIDEYRNSGRGRG